MRLTTAIAAALAAATLFAPNVRAQGGPPMLTDDPGTPDAGHIELNLAATLERTPHEQSWALPVIDFNYGITDRIQLNLITALVLLKRDGSGPIAGPGTLAAAVKWRFLDERSDGISVSINPRIERNVLRSSVRRGLVDDGTHFWLPIEIARSFGAFRLDAEVGSILNSIGPSEWIYGLVGGVTVSPATAVMAELHGSSRSNFGDDRLTVNLGIRQKLTEGAAFIGSLGHDLRSPADEPLSLVSYCGIQFEF